MASSRLDLDGNFAKTPAVRDAVGRAMRFDDAVREFREQRARRRGLVSAVVPYAGYGSTEWVRVLGRVLLTNTSKRSPSAAARGWRSFTTIPVDRVPVRITVGDVEQTVLTDRGGLVDARIEASLAPGWQTVRMTAIDPGSAPGVAAPVLIFDPDEPLGIVSDIDDTVMVTALPRPLVAAWNTFVLDEHARTATPGMAVCFDRLAHAHPKAPVIYLSTGAWNVAPTITRFLSRNLFPPGPLLLTDWGPTPDRVFRSGRAHKKAQLERLAAEFPKKRWLLIGDDGQHDETIYAGFAAAHPGNVEAVAIRQLSPPEAMLAGGRSRFRRTRFVHDAASHTHRDGPAWVQASDGKGLVTALTRFGLLP